MARKTQRTWALIAAVVLVGCSGGTVATPPVSEVDADRPHPALGVVEAFIDAFNAGDVEAALGMIDVMERDVTGSYLADGAEFLRFEEETGRPWLAFEMAAGTQKANPECVTGSEAATGTTVTCTFETRLLYREAVGAPPLATTATFEVADGYIVGLEEVVDTGAAEPSLRASPYIDWMMDSYPDDAALAGTVEWETLAAAIAAGEADARHVDEYAAYLEENGCKMTGCIGS